MIIDIFIRYKKKNNSIKYGNKYMYDYFLSNVL